MTTLESRISNLTAGQSIITSSCNGITCSVERTTDGKKLRFVRTFADGSFTVYHTCSFTAN